MVLSLCSVSQVLQLANALCKHANLRVLDLHCCHNHEVLPKEIGSLMNLTNLDISKRYLQDWMPKRLASLTNLRFLKGFLVVEDETSCVFASLAGLKELNKMSLYVSRIDFPSEDEQSVLRELTLLRDFAIHWGGQTVTRKLHEQFKVDRPSAGQEGVSGGLGGNGCSVVVPSTSEQEAETRLELFLLFRNKVLVTKADKILEGERDTAAQVTTDIPAATEDRDTMDQSLGKGRGETSNEVTTSNPPMKKVLSRISMPLVRKENSATESGTMLEAVDKLVLQCFPQEEVPSWLAPSNVPKLKQLHIKVGRLQSFGDAWGHGTLKIEVLRLNYLHEFELYKKDLLTYFPKLIRLAKAECPKRKLSRFRADDGGIRIHPRGGL